MIEAIVEGIAMDEKEVLQLFNGVGAIITDSHVVYTSGGKHGATYINKDAVYPHTATTSRLCFAIAERFIGDHVEVVIAPAMGGIILSQWTAHHLSVMNGYEVFAVYAEKSEDVDGFVIRRGHEKFISGKNVLVVEDVLSTGGSAKSVVEAVRLAHGNVIGLGALCNRGRVASQDVADVPKLIALFSVQFDTWDAAVCPLCKRGIPINTAVGKGRELLAKLPA